MSVFNTQTLVADEHCFGTPAILDKNWQTTTAVGLTVASGGVAGAIMLAAFPAQTLATGSAIGGLAVAGHRRANGKDPLFGLMDRFSKKSDKKSDEKTESDVKAAEPAAA